MITSRDVDSSMIYAIINATNLARIADIGTFFHADQMTVTAGDFKVPTLTVTTVTAAAAADLPTTQTLANQIKTIFNQHMADAVPADSFSCGCHKAADATNKVATANAVDLASSIALLNQLKASFNAHLVQAGVHYTNDATNTVATVNATDLPTSITLANAIKTAINAHMASAPAGHGVRVSAP